MECRGAWAAAGEGAVLAQPVTHGQPGQAQGLTQQRRPQRVCLCLCLWLFLLSLSHTHTPS